MDIAMVDANNSCFCFALRRASRAVSQRYDHALGCIGLRSTQFNLMAGMAQHEAKTLTQLAIYLGMDRTTLTRNLKPLLRAGWIATLSVSDRRSRPYCLTEKGKEILQLAFPIWAQYQQQIYSLFGKEYCENMLVEFNHIIERSKNLV